MTERYFKNDMRDFVAQENLLDDYDSGKVNPQWLNVLRFGVKNLVQQLNIEPSKDTSIYTGNSGIALLLWKLSQSDIFTRDEKETYLRRSLSLVKSSMKGKPSHRITFACGYPGLLAVASVVFKSCDEPAEKMKCLTEITNIAAECANDSDLPNEILYGRSGYLYSLLYVISHHGNDCIPHNVIEKICQYIIYDGERLAKADAQHPAPLKFTWHNKEYYGAAHGYVGILLCLLQEPCIKTTSVKSSLPLINGTLQYLMECMFNSGNLRSSAGNDSDRLVQWCHGATGCVALFIRAYEIFSNKSYLSTAEKCCEVIWERGLLKKGIGLCHGVAGNAYSFLAMFNFTRDQKYLYRALKFAEWCINANKEDFRAPDRPNSLIEGLAGVIYFLVDLMFPKCACFPGYEIINHLSY